MIGTLEQVITKAQNVWPNTLKSRLHLQILSFPLFQIPCDEQADDQDYQAKE